MEIVVAVLVALGLGSTGGFLALRFLNQRGESGARQQASVILMEGEEAKKRLVLEGQEEALRLRAGAEKEFRDQRVELQQQERRVSGRDEQLARRSESLEQRDRALDKKERELETRKADQEEFRRKEQEQLEAISGLSMSDARDVLMKRAEEEGGEVREDVEVERFERRADHRGPRHAARSGGRSCGCGGGCHERQLWHESRKAASGDRIGVREGSPAFRLAPLAQRPEAAPPGR